MDIGICTLLLANESDALAERWIPAIQQAGYAYAEAPLARMLLASEAKRRELRARFEDAGLRVYACNNAHPKGFASIGPHASGEATRRYMDDALQTAAFMGASLIVMTGPSRLTVPEQFGWEQGFAPYIAYLREYCELAAQAGIRLALEPVNDEERNFISTLEGAAQVLQAVNRPNISIALDVYHIFKQGREASIPAFLHSGQIGHIHIAQPGSRSFPAPNHAEYFDALLAEAASAGYSGAVSVEAYASDPARDISAAYQLLKKWR